MSKIEMPTIRKYRVSINLAVIGVVFILGVSCLFAQKADRAGQSSVNISIQPVVQINELTIKELLHPKGRPLLINFWATWCIPCREEFPDLVRIDEEYRDRIDFITISLDDPAEITRDVPKFLIEMKAKMPVYLLYTSDENAVIGSISDEWEGGLPFTVLYAESGEIAHSKQGKIKPDVVKATIDTLINNK